jgi:hypothetical protein
MNSAPDACRDSSVEISRRGPIDPSARRRGASTGGVQGLGGEAAVGSHAQRRLRRPVEAAT